MTNNVYSKWNQGNVTVHT